MVRKRFIDRPIIVVYLLGFIAGVSFISIFNFWKDSQKIRMVASDKRLPSQHLISPLIECAARENDPKDFQNPLSQFPDEIRIFLEENKIANDGLRANIYFQDLKSGLAFDLEDKTTLRAGSLLKVPLVLSYYKRSETESDLLQTKILFSQSELLKLYEVQGVKPAKTLQVGMSYTIEQLMTSAILYSDNVAATLLEDFDHHAGLKKIALDLDIPVHEGVPPLRPSLIKDYASYFRILYNAGYLNQKNSNDFLELLTKTDYKEGLVAGVPTDVVVAHKFGESTSLENSEIHFLNDCGIVYLPNRPYLLCISVYGKESDQMTPLVQKISKLFYKKMADSF